LGSMLQELGRLEEAEVSYRKAIFLKNDYNPAIAGLGKVLMKKGQHKEGLANLRRGNGAIFFNFENGVTIQ
jgi:tetratricopeptide (TPR) repeat protein